VAFCPSTALLLSVRELILPGAMDAMLASLTEPLNIAVNVVIICPGAECNWRSQIDCDVAKAIVALSGFRPWYEGHSSPPKQTVEHLDYGGRALSRVWRRTSTPPRARVGWSVGRQRRGSFCGMAQPKAAVVDPFCPAISGHFSKSMCLWIDASCAQDSISDRTLRTCTE
jgi:hypothetical protein